MILDAVSSKHLLFAYATRTTISLIGANHVSVAYVKVNNIDLSIFVRSKDLALTPVKPILKLL